MLPDPKDLPDFDIPEVIYECRPHRKCLIRLLPHRGMTSGFDAEVSWDSARTGKRELFRVKYGVVCHNGNISLRYPDQLLWNAIEPRSLSHDARTECKRAWYELDVPGIIEGQKLVICRYVLLKSLAAWKRAFSLTELPRRHELAEDMLEFAEQTMHSLQTQFPDEEHVFPIALPEPMAGFTMR